MRTNEFDSEELEFRSELKKSEMREEASLQTEVNRAKHADDIALAKYKHRCDVRLKLIGALATVATGFIGIAAYLWADSKGISRNDIKTGASSSNLFPKQ